MAVAICMSRISSSLFLLLNVIGAVAWGVAFGIAGYLSGLALRTLMGNLERYEIKLPGLILACLILVWIARFRRRRRSGMVEPSENEPGGVAFRIQNG
jgi:membrane protein DedA with SNARE-associated domain